MYRKRNFWAPPHQKTLLPLWLGGGAYFDGMEDLEAGKFKKNDKVKILNEKLHDQGGSTLKSP